MHDLSLTLFYKTSMDIESTDADGDVLWSLICDVRKWMTHKWERRGVSIPSDNKTWSSFKKGSRFSDSGGRIQFSSAIYYAEDGRHKWACSIEENNIEKGYAARMWVTEVGLSLESPSRGSVSLVLSYGDQPGFLGPCQDEPCLSMPGIVGILMSDARLKCSVSGVEVTCQAKELGVGMFPSFWALLSDQARETPVIFISPRLGGEKPELLVDPQVLADAVGPSALVFYTRDIGFVEEMLATIPDYSYRCANGTVRAYAARPRTDDPTDQYRHRYFTASAIEQIGADALVAMFRRAYAQDVNFYETMIRTDVVRAMVHRSSLTKRVERRVEQVEEEALGIASDIEEQLLRKAGEVDALRDENSQIKSAIHDLELKVASYEAALSYGALDGAEPKEMWLWPQTPHDVIAAFQHVCDDRIAFTRRAMCSLDDCRSSTETIWNALHDLRTIAYALHESDERTDIAAEFNRRSRFVYARGAGMMTRKDNKLMQQYVDEYDGRRIDVEAHLKSGNKESDPKFIRIYFGYDELTRRIVVSYIGAHLDTYSTRFRR